MGATANRVRRCAAIEAGQEPTDPRERVLKLARENPATVANVVRGWVNAES
ncbi:MAG: hypothetical protein R3E48_06110 [Burkholderiaceae bacterium]